MSEEQETEGTPYFIKPALQKFALRGLQVLGRGNWGQTWPLPIDKAFGSPINLVKPIAPWATRVAPYVRPIAPALRVVDRFTGRFSGGGPWVAPVMVALNPTNRFFSAREEAINLHKAMDRNPSNPRFGFARDPYNASQRLDLHTQTNLLHPYIDPSRTYRAKLEPMARIGTDFGLRLIGQQSGNRFGIGLTRQEGNPFGLKTLDTGLRAPMLGL